MKQIWGVINNSTTKLIDWLVHGSYGKWTHLTVSWDEKGLRVSLQDHRQYVEDLCGQLNILKQKYKPERYILEALKLCKRCDVVIFNCGDEKLFIQFLWHRECLRLNYPMYKNNHLGKYKYPVLGLLAENGFYLRTEAEKGENKFPQYSFYFEGERAKVNMWANFGRKYELAAEIVCRVMKEIFKQDLNQVDICII